MNDAVQTEFSLKEFDETIRVVLDSGGEFRIYPKGTSMLPLIRQGRDSVVLVKSTKPPKKGDIAFYLRDNGGYVLHRILKAENGLYTMCGDNQLVLEKGISEGQIIAIVDRLYRGDNCVKLSAFSYKIYCFFWRSFFLRRVYFKLRSIKNGRLKGRS